MTDLDRLAQLDRAAVRRKLAREHAQERRFARAVSAHDADAVAAQKAVGKITEDRPPVIALGDVLQCDDLLPRRLEAAESCTVLSRSGAFWSFSSS